MQKSRSRLAANKSPAEDMQEGEQKQPLDLTALRQTSGFMIRLLQIQIFEEFFEYFSATGFTPAEHSALMLIRDNPSVTQSEVANALRIQLPNLVKILSKLETKGYIKRRRSSRDKRAVELMLTARGRQVAAQASDMGDDFNRLVLSPLTEKERSQFVSMLGRLVRARPNRRDQD
jgi:DNA-binding MarR family transcriptional regulator